MDKVDITTLRKNLFSTLEKVANNNEPIMVMTKKGNAVILSQKNYDSIVESIYFISQPRLVEKIKEGEKEERSTMKAFQLNEEW